MKRVILQNKTHFVTFNDNERGLWLIKMVRKYLPQFKGCRIKHIVMMCDKVTGKVPENGIVHKFS